MRNLICISFVAGGILFSSTSQATITGMNYAGDGDGAVVCPVYTWDGNVDALSMSGDQYWGPGHILGTITTDTAGEDPTLTLNSAIINDTTFAWTAYQVNVYMNNTFTLSGVSASLPADWTVASVSAVVPVVNPLGSFGAQILFMGGTPVAVGGELDISYQLSFSGATSYSFAQEMIPVPEPGTSGFLAAGALLLAGCLAVGRRKRQT